MRVPTEWQEHYSVAAFVREIMSLSAVPTSRTLAEVYYGILKAGAVVVPLNILLKAPEVAYHLQDCQARALFCFAGNAELPIGREGYAGFEQSSACELFVLMGSEPALEESEAVSYEELLQPESTSFETAITLPNDTAVILYTSGTTGKPKGAELSHSNLLLNAFVSRDLSKVRPVEVGLLTLPMFHSFGQTVQMNCFVLGGGHQRTDEQVRAPQSTATNAPALCDFFCRSANDVLGSTNLRQPR